MKQGFSALVLAILVVCVPVDAQPAPDQCDPPETQLQLNQCASASMQAADSELLAFMAGYRKRLSPSQADLLEQSHASWETFRRDACAFEASGVEGGSAYPMVFGLCMADRASRRLEELQEMARCEEGDLSCPAPDRGPAPEQ